jgi:hypothetical protein
VTETVVSLELDNLTFLIEVGVHGKQRCKRTVVRDAAEGSAIRWTLKEISEDGFHKIDELLVRGVLGPAPLEVAHAFA